MPHILDRFFDPGSVAIVGASATEGKPGNEVIRNIVANGYQGRLYAVNPKGGEIMGFKVSRSIGDLPRGIDLAVILLPAKLNANAVRECAGRGIGAVVLAAGGFSEVDAEGEKTQEELAAAIRETGIRAIGPNTSGHISTPSNFTSSFFPLGRIPAGHISYIAQTGNFATHTMRYIASGEHFGVARVVGLGNKVDIDESDVLEYYEDDDETRAVFVYLESLARPRRFLEIARRVSRKKPIILLKGGSTSEGASAAVAHTAALASDDRIIEGVLKQAGITRIHKYSHLFLVAKALSAMPLPKGDRVSFLAPSGALLVVLTDLCRRKWGLQVPRLRPETRERLQEISPAYVRMRNPVDIWPSAIVHGIPYAYREGMEAVLKDPGIDAVVAVLMIRNDTRVEDLDFIVELARKYPEKPVYVAFGSGKEQMDAAREYLEPNGIPTFPLIEQPFEVLSVLCRCRRLVARNEDPDSANPVTGTEIQSRAAAPGEFAATVTGIAETILSAARQGSRDRLSEYESKQVLSAYGIPVAREMLAEDIPGAREAASRIGYPVVLKACSPELSHKTEAGLVITDLQDEQSLSRAAELILQRSSGQGPPGSETGILVQEMVRGQRELAMGLTRDPQFGPCVMFGLGGVLTEALGDVAFRMAPLSRADALEMMQEIRGREILGPVRGMAAADLEILARCLVALGEIGLEHGTIREIDINPLIIRDGRPVAVDALVVLQQPPCPDRP